jgi:hypothetical protein
MKKYSMCKLAPAVNLGSLCGVYLSLIRPARWRHLAADSSKGMFFICRYLCRRSGVSFSVVDP